MTKLIVEVERPFPHLKHLVLTLLTCGFWLPVWVVHWLIVGVVGK